MFKVTNVIRDVRNSFTVNKVLHFFIPHTEGRFRGAKHLWRGNIQTAQHQVLGLVFLEACPQTGMGVTLANGCAFSRKPLRLLVPLWKVTVPGAVGWGLTSLSLQKLYQKSAHLLPAFRLNLRLAT